METLAGIALKISTSSIASDLTSLAGIVEQLEFCKFECQSGLLENDVAFIKLREIVNRYRREEESVSVTIDEKA